MDLHINHQTADDSVLRLFVNGTFHAEIFLGAVTDRDDLEERITWARRLEKLPDLIRNMVSRLFSAELIPAEGLGPEQKAVEFCAGLEDGFHLLSVPTHSIPPVVRPSQLRSIDKGKTKRGTVANSLPYNIGYQYGEALRTLLDLVEEADPGGHPLDKRTPYLRARAEAEGR